MGLQSGFYNAFNVNGVYDRVYSADEYTNFLNAFLKDGVRRSGADDFLITANGLTISAGVGFAICGGKWVHNDAELELGAITPPVGDFSRVDAVVLRVNNNESDREASIFIRTGTAGSNPQAPAKQESENIKELILATITVAPSATAVTVKDTRGDASLCGWVTTPVGYDDYFTSLDSLFLTWFNEKKDTLASVTLFKKYIDRIVTEDATSSITFSIPQYDSTGVDIIEVYVNGLLETEGIDYRLTGSTIEFLTTGGGTGSKVAGTEIVVICYKSIDGEGLGSVSDEVTALQDQVNKLSSIDSYTYVCNGKDDNVKLSQLAQAWLNGGTDYSSKTISIYGTFGASAPVSGTGASASPAVWLNAGVGSKTNRKLVLDFSNCEQVSINCASYAYNIIFYGYEANVKGVNLVVEGTGADVKLFSVPSDVQARLENSRVWVNAKSGTVARSGDFINNRISFSSSGANLELFKPYNTSLLRVNGGEYYAYAGTGFTSSVIAIDANQTDAVAITYGISCPTLARAGFVQSNAINVLNNSATCSFTDTVTALPITAGGQNIRGTIARSKATM